MIVRQVTALEQLAHRVRPDDPVRGQVDTLLGEDFKTQHASGKFGDGYGELTTGLKGAVDGINDMSEALLGMMRAIQDLDQQLAGG